MIAIPPDLLERIACAAEAAWPTECCGLVVGNGPPGRLRVHEIVPAANLLADTFDRFELDPAMRLKTEKKLRGGPFRVIGHYHSHPDGSPLPSAEDLARAWEPGMVWLIAAVKDGRTLSITAHRPRPDRRCFRQIRLETTCALPASSP